MKRNKKDKLFWIQFDQSNRDYLSNIAIFMLTYAISLVALILSVIAIIISIAGITPYSIAIIIVLGGIMVVAAFWFSKKVKMTLNNSKNLNQQLQKELIKLYPEYKKKYH